MDLPVISNQLPIADVTLSSNSSTSHGSLEKQSLIRNVQPHRPSSPVVIITEPGATSAQPNIIRLVARPVIGGMRSVTSLSADGTSLRLAVTDKNQQQQWLRPVGRLPVTVTGSRLPSVPSAGSSIHAVLSRPSLENSALVNAMRGPGILKPTGMLRAGRPAGLLSSSMSSPNLMSLGGGSHILYDNATGQIITNIRPPTATGGRIDESRMRKTLTAASGLVQVMNARYAC